MGMDSISADQPLFYREFVRPEQTRKALRVKLFNSIRSHVDEPS
jgi:hypothetical protein